ncbi:MAG TPA: metallophosphoesterase family protein [Candidatus Tectomicrobia bacterium]|jgi:putative phosphoesterase
MKVLIVSDIHANWPALSAVVAAEPYDHLLCLGDLVDYGPHPRPCLAYIRQHADWVIRGNHDNALGFDVDCGCRGDFHELSVTTRAWHRTLIDEDDRAFLRSLPLHIEMTIDGYRFYLGHAAPHDDLFTYLTPATLPAAVADVQVDFLLLGHTHLPVHRRIGTVTAINPGSVGLPRDSGGKANYAVYEAGTITLKQVRYDVEVTITDLQRGPLPAAVVERLAALLRA